MFGSASSGWHCDSWELVQELGLPHVNMFVPGQKVFMLIEHKKLLSCLARSRSMRYFTQSAPNSKVHGGLNSCLRVDMEHFKLCWCRGQALPSESCLHISWPERLVSPEPIRRMKTMRSLRRCWSRPRVLRSESHTHTHTHTHI